MRKGYIPGKPFNHHREDPTKKPPPGWKVENVVWQRLTVQAARTGCQELIKQVGLLKDAYRGDLVIVMEVVSQAARGDIDPDTLNLEQIIDDHYKEQGEPDDRKTTEKTVQSPVSETDGVVKPPAKTLSFQAAADLLSNGNSGKARGTGTKGAQQLPLC